MNKKDLNERDICSKFITPAILKSGWDLTTQIREEVRFTKGRIIVRGKLVTLGKDKRAEYILYFKPNIPIAIVGADQNARDLGSESITPAILNVGCDLATQSREEVRSGGNPAPIEEDNSRTMRPPTVGSTVGHRRGSTILSTNGGQS